MNSFWLLFFVTLSFVGIAVLLLGLRTLILKDGRFPNTSVSGNKELRKLGIACAKCEEQAKYNRMRKSRKIDPKNLVLAPVSK